MQAPNSWKQDVDIVLRQNDCYANSVPHNLQMTKEFKAS